MVQQPAWTRFLPEALVVNLATLGWLGRLPAPGTWGSAAGLVWFTVVCVPAGPIVSAILSVGILYLAFALCGEAEFRMRKVDPAEVVLDEFAAMPLVLMGSWDVLATGEAWFVFVLGFVLFRFFDIVKPLGIRSLQRFPGGIGVLLDDVAAALASLLVLQIILRLTPVMTWLAQARG